MTNMNNKFLVAVLLFIGIAPALFIFTVPTTILLSFIPDREHQSSFETELAEECLLIGRQWNDKVLSCDMTPISAIFSDNVKKHGRSSMSEHLAFNKFKEVAKEIGGSVKLRGCIYLLQSYLVKQGTKVESVYDEDTLNACVGYIQPDEG